MHINYDVIELPMFTNFAVIAIASLYYGVLSMLPWLAVMSFFQSHPQSPCFKMNTIPESVWKLLLKYCNMYKELQGACSLAASIQSYL